MLMKSTNRKKRYKRRNRVIIGVYWSVGSTHSGHWLGRNPRTNSLKIKRLNSDILVRLVRPCITIDVTSKHLLGGQKLRGGNSSAFLQEGTKQKTKTTKRGDIQQLLSPFHMLWLLLESSDRAALWPATRHWCRMASSKAFLTALRSVCFLDSISLALSRSGSTPRGSNLFLGSHCLRRASDKHQQQNKLGLQKLCKKENSNFHTKCA